MPKATGGVLQRQAVEYASQRTTRPRGHRHSGAKAPLPAPPRPCRAPKREAEGKDAARWRSVLAWPAQPSEL